MPSLADVLQTALCRCADASAVSYLSKTKRTTAPIINSTALKMSQLQKPNEAITSGIEPEKVLFTSNANKNETQM